MFQLAGRQYSNAYGLIFYKIVVALRPRLLPGERPPREEFLAGIIT
jgi:hypothetical protein